jgi:hypothetical protein
MGPNYILLAHKAWCARDNWQWVPLLSHSFGSHLDYPWRTSRVHQQYLYITNTPCLCASGSLEWASSHDNARKLQLAPGGADSRLNGQSLVKKWRPANPKMIVAKNQEVDFLAIKCKTAPVLAKSAGVCTKFKIYHRRLPQRNKSWYAYLRWSIIYVGCFSSFWFHV